MDHHNVQIKGVVYTIEKLPIRKSYSLLRHEGVHVSAVAYFKSEEEAKGFREFFRELEKIAGRILPKQEE
jgi:hypothetical protein